VTDDGLPESPGVVTHTWTAVSGPGTVTFGDAMAVDTTVSFSAEGVYVLRLMAGDGHLAASSKVTITVVPANSAPSVSAGLDQTLSLGDVAHLDGMVTDDGLPDPPGAVTTTWSVFVGTGTVTFGNDMAVDTTASFSAEGDYVLELMAFDGELFASDLVTFTVTPGANQPPSVDAGADQTISLRKGAKLHATVTDDGLPDPPGAVTTTWSVVTGTGTVTFRDDSAVETRAKFSAAGEYVLCLTAYDGELSAIDFVTITVNPVSEQAPTNG
jgi:hypothetical protein